MEIKVAIKKESEDCETVESVFDGASRYFSLLAEPMRLRIIHSMCAQERSVGEIVKAVGASQANVSRHLSMLNTAGVLGRRKQGNFVFYSVSDPTLTDVCRAVCNRTALQMGPDKQSQGRAYDLANDFKSTGS
jgi:DNA-binding transcriptional ArsR family regulator